VAPVEAGPRASWTSSAEVVPGAEQRDRARELQLVDRVLGLEAENARLSTRHLLTPTAELAAEERLEQLSESAAWRLGWLLTSPLRIVRRAKRALLG